MKDKVAKLLAMAHDGRGNEFEADAALRQAEKLMRKHGIDAAELQDRTGQRPVYNWEAVYVPAGAPQPVQSSPLWFGWLISSIGKFTDCKVGYGWPGHGHGVCAKFEGDEVDVEYAVWLCKHLRDDCRRQAAAFPGDRAERESFRKGYVLRIQQRMRDLLAERQEALRAAVTSTGTALVVVEAKLAARDAQFGAQEWGRSRTVTLRPSGRAAGMAAGNRVGFGRPVGGAATARLGRA